MQQIARHVDVPDPAVSKHTKLLAGYHLVQTTPSGRYVYCAAPAANSTNNSFLKEMQNLLRQIFIPGKGNRALAQVCDYVGAARGSWEEVYCVLFAHYTAYTHLRRLLLVRQLAREGACSCEELESSVGMSPDAAGRHLDKLRRRGLVRQADNDSKKWELAGSEKAAFRQSLLEAVLHALVSEEQ